MSARSSDESPKRGPSIKRIITKPIAKEVIEDKQPEIKRMYDDRSGKKYQSKDLGIPDEIEAQLHRIFPIEGFKGLLYKVALASKEGGDVIIVSSKGEGVPTSVPKDTSILIEIPYEYSDGIYTTSSPYLYYYDYYEESAKSRKKLIDKEITLNKEGELQGKVRTVKIERNGKVISKLVGDQLGHRYNISEYLDGGIIIKPFNRTSGVVIIKMEADMALKVSKATTNMYKPLKESELEEFFLSKHKEIKKHFMNTLETALKENPVRKKVKADRLMNAHLYLLPISIDKESGNDRFLVPEFLWLMNRFMDAYKESELEILKSAIAEYKQSPKVSKKGITSDQLIDLIKSDPKVIQIIKKKLNELTRDK
jgi:hypothetical protein